MELLPGSLGSFALEEASWYVKSLRLPRWRDTSEHLAPNQPRLPAILDWVWMWLSNPGCPTPPSLQMTVTLAGIDSTLVRDLKQEPPSQAIAGFSTHKIMSKIKWRFFYTTECWGNLFHSNSNQNTLYLASSLWPTVMDQTSRKMTIAAHNRLPQVVGREREE